MEFKEVVKNRYSCKKFSEKQVEGEKLTAILEAGRLAGGRREADSHPGSGETGSDRKEPAGAACVCSAVQCSPC